jgi:hypothetical protein
MHKFTIWNHVTDREVGFDKLQTTGGAFETFET